MTGSLRRRNVIIAVALLLALLGVTFLVLRPSGPREKFRKELRAKVDGLVRELRNFKPGVKEEEGRAMWGGSDGKMRGSTGKLPFSRSFLVAGHASNVDELFEHVSLALLLEDPAGFDAWGDRLRVDIKQHKARVNKELPRIKEAFRRDPDAYRWLYGPTLKWTKDDKLVFVQGDYQGYVVENVLSLDLEAWLKSVKQKAQDFRK